MDEILCGNNTNCNSTMKYSAINIGPIISTLGMARKPRELWAASFLFSHLMKCIYAEAEKAKAVILFIIDALIQRMI